MPTSSTEGRGSKAKYSDKQKRKAEHIEKSYEDKGASTKKAESIAWATVNKQSGGGERGGSGENKKSEEKSKARKDSAQKAADTKADKSKPNSLESQTKAELMEQARKKDIHGRSSMNKEDLVLALRRSS